MPKHGGDLSKYVTLMARTRASLESPLLPLFAHTTQLAAARDAWREQLSCHDKDQDHFCATLLMTLCTFDVCVLICCIVESNIDFV